MKHQKIQSSCTILIILAAGALFFTSCSGTTRTEMNVGQINAVSRLVPDMPKVMSFQSSYKTGNGNQAVPVMPFEKVQTAAADPITNACLQCHGPFEELMERTKDYVNEWDVTVNPHTYVDITKGNPHDTTMIATCTECHEQHPIPPTANMNIKQANLQYCYTCHHDEEFISCNTCHG
ncbi:cytochrome c3 family protein [Breznakiella homolactica]|uniref:Cytochrome c3 family protein n=1 Tax=Breznakiella homolactica TaxID=2798577 RepID=A0A7T7XPB6_9SPIR|nr:cytochrome c3 family protein [Breznakiella homolactica]QQO09998.1 cytochrome c3 family protein [Breznakiella homolactica]